MSLTSSTARAERLAPAPVGFNCYALLENYLQNGSTTDVQIILDYVASCDANIVRILYPVFSGQEWLSVVFEGGQLPSGTIRNANFKSTFLTASDYIFAHAEERGIKLHVCLFWLSSALPALSGETYVQSMSLSSATYRFMVEFTIWFAGRYGSRAGLGAVSFFNEPELNPTGVLKPTAAAVGQVTTGLVAALRTGGAHDVLTVSDLAILPLELTPSRQTVDSQLAELLEITAGCDAIGLHVYADAADKEGSAFVGTSYKPPPFQFAPDISNDLGFEGIESLLSALASAADLALKPLVLSETSVTTGMEADSALPKKMRLLRAATDRCLYTLLWDCANRANPIPEQEVFQIRPNTLRGGTFKRALNQFNSGRNKQTYNNRTGGGTKALLASQQPTKCFKTTSGSAPLSVTLMDDRLSTPSIAFMCWYRLDAPVASQFIVDCRGAGDKAGFAFLLNLDLEPYVAFRKAPGASTLDTSGRILAPQSGVFQHFACFLHVVGNTQLALELWNNGMYWFTVSAELNTYAPIPNPTPTTPTTLYFGGTSGNGSSVSLQDVCVTPRCEPEDILNHMRGIVMPSAQLFLRAADNNVLDVARGLQVNMGGATVGL